MYTLGTYSSSGNHPEVFTCRWFARKEDLGWECLVTETNQTTIIWP